MAGFYLSPKTRSVNARAIGKRTAALACLAKARKRPSGVFIRSFYAGSQGYRDPMNEVTAARCTIFLAFVPATAERRALVRAGFHFHLGGWNGWKDKIPPWVLERIARRGDGTSE